VLVLKTVSFDAVMVIVRQIRPRRLKLDLESDVNDFKGYLKRNIW
jgi:hypothetical protein